MKYLLLALCCSCSTVSAHLPTTAPEFEVVFAATGDGSAPLAGVKVLDGKRVLGTTGADGSARVRLLGREGDTVALTVECPERYASPEAPVFVGLRALASGSPRPRFVVECPAVVHSIAVGLKVENGARLSILHLNKVVGRTDLEGLAHVLLEAPANEPVTLQLDTSADDSLMPQNPMLSFVSGPEEELVLLRQKLTVKKKPKPLAKKVARPERL